MLHRNHHRYRTLPDNVIPLNRKKRPPSSAANWPLEAFVVRTDIFFFLALVDQREKRDCRGKGHVTFANGESIFFNTDAGEYGQVRDRCLDAAGRIASIYHATLERGVVDCDGSFQGSEMLPMDTIGNRSDSV